MKKSILISSFILLFISTVSSTPQVIPNGARPWIRWWWLGSAVDSTNIKAELVALKKAGFGGVEITPLYGVKGEEERFLSYLSPQWVDMLAYTLDVARELELGVDMNHGTGWPFGGPQTTPDNAAQKLIIKHSPADSILNAPGDIIALIVPEHDDKIISKNFDKHLQSLSTQRVTVIYRVGTKQMVKRAAPGAEGLVMDHFSTLAVEQYFARYDTSISNEQFDGLRCLFNDSYEVYNADWTPNLFNAFKKYRDYDLRDHLDNLAGYGDPDIVARVKCDYRETLSDMLLYNFTESWTQWAHDRNCLTRNQAHGSPANLLDLYATVDIPETEIYGPSGFPIPGLRTDPDFPSHDSTPPDPLMMKFASSAANVGGKELSSSETFTWLGEHFRTSLTQCKPEIDQLFTTGINHLFFHGNSYSPQDAEWPGWLFYASMQFGKVNSIWRDIEYMNEYITNCQIVLQNSGPDNDILLYWPVHNLWQNPDGLMQQFMVHNLDEWLFPTDFYKIAKLLLEKGHSFDYISDKLLENITIDQGQLKINDRAYQTIIVPKTEIMPLASVEKLYQLAESGATVIFHEQYPRDVPGLHQYEKRRKKLSKIINTASQLEQGNFETSHDLLTDLEKHNVNRETLTDMGLSFIRKTYMEQPMYFVSNLSDKKIDDWVPFALQPKAVWLSKPLVDCPGQGLVIPTGDNESRVYLQLEPGESVFLLFNMELFQEYCYYEKTGKMVTLNGLWKLDFIKGGPVLPKTVKLNSLVSWTDMNSDEAYRFAGTGSYSTTFSKPDVNAEYWELDLRTVYESARVKLNGEQLGVLWSLPFKLMVPDALLREKNTLEIEVTNTSANRIIDMDKRKIPWKRFYDINFVDLNYHAFDASQWGPVPSGLVGPVTLTPMKIKTPAFK